MSNRYLRKNRYGVFCLRFELQSKPIKKYRQFLISLGTKDYETAFKLYCELMPSVYTVLSDYNENLRRSMAGTLTVAEVKDTIKGIVEKIVEANTSPSRAGWWANIQERRLGNYLDDTFAAMEWQESEINQLKQTLGLSIKKENQLIEALVKKSSPVVSSTSTSESRPVGELVDDYFDFKKNSWSDRTSKQALSNLTRFAEIIGYDTLSSDIDGKLIQHYHSVLKRIPKNSGKKRSFLESSEPQKIKDWWANTATSNNSSNALASGGLEKHFSDIRMFIKWLHERHYINLDFSKHLEISKQKNHKDHEKRAMYESKHLAKVFSSYIYGNHLRHREQPKSFHFWAPLIALTTGMRVAEIACLEVQDIRLKDGILIFSLNDEWATEELGKGTIEKSKKTRDSIRDIPVPEILINAGLKEFIGKRRDGLLFNDLQLSSSKGLGNTISKWYNESFVRYAEIPKKNDKNTPITFHSFRHTFISLLDKTLIDSQPLRRNESFYITGHRDESVRTQTYNHDSYSMPMIKNYIDAIDFGFDLSGISYQRFLLRTTGRRNR